jgi:hypothetical protein
MFDPEQSHRYLELAAKLGLDTTDEHKVHGFITMLRWVDAKLKDPRVDRRVKGGKQALAEELGIPYQTIAIYEKSDVHRIATQVALAEFMTNESRTDMRNRLFGLYQNWFPQALENTLRIAAGRVLGANGQPAERQPAYTAQVQAFQAISANPLAEAWLNNTFLGEQEIKDEEEHVQLREALKQKPSLQLDGPVDEPAAPAPEPIDVEWAPIPDPHSSNP